MDIDELSNGEKVSLGGAAATIVGAFLPWISLGPFGSVSGIDGDGVFTLLFGVAVIALIVVRDWERIDVIAVGILGALTLLISGNIYIDLPGGAGIGLYLTLVGGIALLAGAGLGYQETQAGGSGTGAF